MREILTSFAIGTLGLTALLAMSAALVWRRPGTRSWALGPARMAVVANLLLHALHLAEETVFGFHVRFPALLGLAPWPTPLFVGFNLVWVGVWASALVPAALGRGLGTCCWFLALASIANAVAHPLLSLVTRGYFPGLLTAPLVGLAGVVLLRSLYRATSLQPTAGFR